jgi:hypothetical protein
MAVVNLGDLIPSFGNLPWVPAVVNSLDMPG